MSINAFTPIPLPPPGPFFEEALGYWGGRRFVVFFADGDACRFCDGARLDEGNRLAWDELPGCIAGAVAGDSLLVDRRNRRLYAAPLAAGMGFVVTANEPHEEAPGPLGVLVAAARDAGPASGEAVRRMLDYEAGLCDQFRAWSLSLPADAAPGPPLTVV